MHLHILGIGGTFMGSLAQLAKAQGHRVTGADAQVYPPMSTQLADAGIDIVEGYHPSQLQPEPDLVVIGNAMSRGNPAVEAVLERGIPYVSGPQWLHDHLLPGKWVLAVAGTHGKTTTSSMVAWILEYAGMAPGYLIGGVPGNFGHSARLSPDSPFFVVEADEYDTAFFDKRSKFVHYLPRTLVINNLEFDHADIFPDLAAIQQQFHHLLRVVPGNGLVIYPNGVPAIDEVLAKGCWTPRQTLGQGGDWQAELLHDDGSAFKVQFQGEAAGEVRWQSLGRHNVANALAAMAAARHVGVRPEIAAEALSQFQGVKRRMEQLGEFAGVTVYDDFAHHPTAIATTLAGLRAKVGADKILAVIEPRSNTMRAGVHREQLTEATTQASEVIWFQPPGLDWSLADTVANSPVPATISDDLDQLLAQILDAALPGTHVVIMSNGGFGGIHQRLTNALAERG